PGADVPAKERLQVGDTIAATGVALIAIDAERENQCDRLRDDGEVYTTDPALEHGGTDDVSDEGRHDEHRKSREREAFERHPERGQHGELIPIHEIRNAGRGLNLGGDWVGGFELEEHRHAIAPQPEEDALAETEHAG